MELGLWYSYYYYCHSYREHYQFHYKGDGPCQLLLLLKRTTPRFLIDWKLTDDIISIVFPIAILKDDGQASYRLQVGRC
ncbi:hypothetical protein N9L68_01465 [bacterium]|nr:hypothetical protein [bacterium]